jgi:hypothetical protein
MLDWIAFTNGARDALTDVLDEEIGGTPEEVIQAHMNNPPLSGRPFYAQGYRAVLAMLLLHVRGELPEV